MNVSCIPRIGHSIARGAPSIHGRILEAPEHPVVHILTRISTSGRVRQTLKPGFFCFEWQQELTHLPRTRYLAQACHNAGIRILPSIV